jgi:hypothetical protein
MELEKQSGGFTPRSHPALRLQESVIRWIREPTSGLNVTHAKTNSTEIPIE